MRIDIVRRNSSLKSADPENVRIADQVVELYKELIEKLAARGAGGDVWTMEVSQTFSGRFVVKIASGEKHLGNEIMITRMFSSINDIGKTLDNNYFAMSAQLQSKGIADLVNATGAKAARIWGANTVMLYANIDVGGYAWLRKGFWPDDGRKVLDEFIERGLANGLITSQQATRWKNMSEAELKRFVRSEAFRDYKPAFLGTKWYGRLDLNDPEAFRLFTGEDPPGLAKPTPPPLPKEPDLPVARAGMTANELYRDAALRNQINVRRYSAGLSRQINNLLQRADRELTLMLRERLVRFAGRPVDFTGERWKALLADIRTQRAAALAEVRRLASSELAGLASLEGQREVALLSSAVPIEIAFATVPDAKLRAILTSRPFQGRLLRDWFRELEAGDRRRVEQALQLGLVEGQPIDDIVRRITGTRAQQYADGILAISRRDATAIVRTAVNHVSNAARDLVWQENADITQARVWVATLDGRTSPICRARDGQMAPVGDNPLPEGSVVLSPPDARPPAHINCRSLLVAYIDGIGLVGNRPTVVDTRTRNKREVDFRKLAKQQGKTIQQVRSEWAAATVGRVPAATNYQQFLSRQSAAFQDQVLGRTKGRLFREGGLTLDQFVDRRGNELSLKQLAATRPEAFTRAGLDPGDF